MCGFGWGYVWLGVVLMDLVLVGIEFGCGMLGWGGIYGYGWLMDLMCGLILLVMINIMFEGLGGVFVVEMVVVVMNC